MISESRKKSVIDKVLKSKEFKTSDIYGKLLQYLLSYHLKDEIPKESTIAIEFFNRESTFNPSEVSTVRFHLYKLRKKLKRYYQKEGKNEDIVVSIPKGHYKMQFYKADKNDLKSTSSIAKDKNREKSYIILTSILTLLVVIFAVLWQHSPKIQDPISKSDPIWKSFFKNDYPVNLVIGDLFVFEEREDTTKNFRRIMDYSIVSRDQFLVYQSKNPEKILKELLLAELPHNSIYNIKDIMHVFYSFNKTFDIKFSQSLQYNDLDFGKFFILEQKNKYL